MDSCRHTKARYRYRVDRGEVVKTLVIVATLCVLATGCTSGHEHPFPDSSTGGSHGAVVQLQLVPFPEGPPLPLFKSNAPAGNKFVHPLASVDKYTPVPFPAPLTQPSNCDHGGNLVVTFADGFKLTYGPCSRPSSINRLWAGMISVIEHGKCAEMCGPGGTAGP